MLAPQIPQKEKERMAELKQYHILDTAGECSFDDITKAVATIYNVPIALISFIDDERQWVKSNYGLDVQETPRDLAFCTHTINSATEIVHIEDLSKDEHFHDHPMVVNSPHLKSYTGVPIAGKDGHCIGALCIMDHVPRKHAQDQISLLWSFSKQVTTLLDLRRQNVELEIANHEAVNKQRRWKVLVDHLGDMVYELNEKGKLTYFNPSFVNKSQYTSKELRQKYWWDLVCQDHREKVIHFYKNILENRIASSYLEFCLRSKRGKIWVGQNLDIRFEGKKAVHAYAVARDITDLVEARKKLVENEQKYRLISENSKDVISLHDKFGRNDFISESVTELLGYSPQEIIENTAYDLVHPDDIQNMQQRGMQQLNERGELREIECRLRRKDGDYVWVEANVKTIRNKEGKIIGFQSSTRDIDHRKKSEKALEEKQAKLEALIENTDDAICVIDTDHKYVSFNQAYLDQISFLTGIQPKLGVAVNFDVIHRICSTFQNSVQEAFQGKKLRKLQSFDFMDKRWHLDCHFNPIYGTDAKLFGLAIQTKDVSEKIRARDRSGEQKKSLALLNEIISNTHISVDDQIQRALDVAVNYLNLSIGIVSSIKKNSYRVTHVLIKDSDLKIEKGDEFPLDQTFCAKTHKEITTVAIDNTNEQEYTGHPCYKDLNLKSYIATPFFVKSEQRGTVNFSSHESRSESFDSTEIEFVNLLSRWVGFLIERHEYRQKLLTERNVLKSFVFSAPAAIAMLNNQAEYLAVSNKWLADYNLNEEKLIGKGHFEVLPWTRKVWQDTVEKCLNEGIDRKKTYKHTSEQGETQWIKWEIRPWYHSEKEIGGVVIYTEDITSQKAQQQELKRAKSTAEKASKSKEEFLSTMSHEIRTPMNAIVGVANLLLQEKPKPTQLANLNLLKFSSENLFALINDILDFNKIEAGKVEFEAIDFNLKDLLLSIKQSFLAKASENGLDLLLDYDPDIADVYIGDSVRIAQILNNLVGNAVKFTKDGFVKISVLGISTKDNLATLRFEIKDTGIGMTSNEIKKIFDSFSQGKQEITRKFGGSGLGLAITKRLLHLMKSEIDVISEPGKGSTFGFHLSLERGKITNHKDNDPEIQTQRTKSYSKTPRILIAEDNAANITVITQFLSLWGMEPDVAGNGEEVLEMIKSEDYDLIIMDLRMPKMDGYEAARNIREREKPYFQNIPIIAMTASATVDIKHRVKAVGMDDFVSKPFDPDELFSIITSHLNHGLEKSPNGQRQSGSNNLKASFPYLYQISDGSETMILDILSTIIETVPLELDKLKRQLETKSFDDLAETIHKIKPNLKSLQLRKLYQEAETIDNAATIRDEDYIQDHLQNFSQEINKQLCTIRDDFL